MLRIVQVRIEYFVYYSFNGTRHPNNAFLGSLKLSDIFKLITF